MYDPERRARVDNEIAQLTNYLAPLRVGREPAGPDDDGRKLPDRLAAQARMKELFGFITPETRQPGETAEAYKNRQFQATKDQVKAMLLMIQQSADGLFSTINGLDRKAYQTKFDLAARQLEQVARTNGALAFGLQAAQSRALFNAAGFRTKQAEVEYAIAQGYVEVAQHHAQEERLKLRAAQVDYQQARTQLDLARLDRRLFDRLSQDSALFDTPEDRRTRQTAVWRAARDAAFFVRVYDGIGPEQVDLPTPSVYWGPAAILFYVNRLEEARHRVDFDRAAILDVPDVTAVITVDKRLVDELGQTYYDKIVGPDGDQPAWRRLRISVRGLEGVGKERPIYSVSPYPSRLSWFITDDEVTDLDWELLRDEIKQALPKPSLRARPSAIDPWRRVEKPEDVSGLTPEELLICLNDALTRVQPEAFYAAVLPVRSQSTLLTLTGIGTAPKRAALESMSGDGRLILLNRLHLEAWLPTSLARGTDIRSPHYTDANEIGRVRTALYGVAVFIKNGSADGGLSDSNVPIRVRHLGDGWITTLARDRSHPGRDIIREIPIHWGSPGTNAQYPRPEAPEDLARIQNNPLNEVNERITGGKLDRKLVENTFSTFYPLLGTYEIMIPENMLKPDYVYKVVLLGSSVATARRAANLP